MKKNAARLLALAVSTALVTSLTACGDGSDTTENEVLTPVEAEPMLSELELEILNLETRYNKGEFTQEDYLALADAYSRAGSVRRQRDMLEQDYRLYEDAEAFATLQELSVNLEEETGEIRNLAQEMQNNLELTEYLDESVNLIDSENWFSTMMPKLKEGQRSYYLEQEGQPLLYVQVGYTEEGLCSSKVWYTGNDTTRFLSREGTDIRLVTVTSENSFEAWSLDSASGSITHEQGTLQNGVLTGDYTCEVHAGEGGLDMYSLWSNRESMEYVIYTGSFDTEGRSLTEQPAEEDKAKLLEGTDYTDLIVYAYDADGENCLWQGIGSDSSAEDYRFGSEMIGLETRPEYTSYEVTSEAESTDSTDGTGNTADTTADSTTATDNSADTAPQIRIFDGEIQWFDGKYWVSAGTVKEMAKQDPFAAYEESHTNHAAAGGSITGGTDGNITDGTGVTAGDKNSASIRKPAATEAPTTTAKPAATAKPATTAKPAATPKPAAATPAPTPAPAQNNDNDDRGSSDSSNDNNGGSSDNGSSDSGSSDSGNSDSGSSDSGSSDSGNSDSGSSDSGNSGGNDVDMDWTPDLL